MKSLLRKKHETFMINNGDILTVKMRTATQIMIDTLKQMYTKKNFDKILCFSCNKRKGEYIGDEKWGDGIHILCAKCYGVLE